MDHNKAPKVAGQSWEQKIRLLASHTKLAMTTGNFGFVDGCYSDIFSFGADSHVPPLKASRESNNVYKDLKDIADSQAATSQDAADDLANEVGALKGTTPNQQS